MTPEESVQEVLGIQGEVQEPAVSEEITQQPSAESIPDIVQQGQEGGKEDRFDLGNESEQIETKVASSPTPPAASPEVQQQVQSPSELDLLRAQISSLHEQLQGLAGASTKAAALETKPIDSDFDFLGDVPIEDWASDKGKFNQLLGQVYAKEKKEAKEEALLSLPDSVMGVVSNYMNMARATEGFFNAHQDLRPFPKVVTAVVQELQGQHPDWELAQVFTEAGAETRRRLALVKDAQSLSQPTQPPRQPGFARAPMASSRQPAAPSTASLAAELSEMRHL